MLLIIIFISFLLRLTASYDYELRYSDEAHFIAEAAQLVGEDFGTKPVLFASYKFLFIMMLGVIFTIFGISLKAIVFLNVLIGTATVFLIYLIGNFFFKKKIGLLCALILGLYPFHITISASARSDPLMNFFILLSFYVYLNARKQRSSYLYFITGLLASIAMQIKYMGGVALMLVVIIETYYLIKWILKKSNLKNSILTYIKNMFYTGLGFISIILILVLIMHILGFSYMYFFLGAFGQVDLGDKITHLPLIEDIPRLEQEFHSGVSASLSYQLYYVYYFLITTPVLVMLFFIIGVLSINKIKNKTAHVWLIAMLAILIFIGYGLPRVYFMFLPVLVVLSSLGLYSLYVWQHKQSPAVRSVTILSCLILLIVSLIVGIPYITYRSGYADPVLYQSIKPDDCVVTNNAHIVAYYSNAKTYSWPENQNCPVLIDFEGFQTPQREKLEEFISDKPIIVQIEITIEKWRLADEIYLVTDFITKQTDNEALQKITDKINELFESKTAKRSIVVYDIS